jgi:undecaprenyl-diphosphatase
MSVLLGIVEGLTEFLPVSSTAHLRIAEALMRIPLDDAYWKMYTIVIQLGAIIALILLFTGRIVGFMRTFPGGENGKNTWLTHPISLTLIAFAVTSVPSLLLHKWSDKHLGSIAVIAWAMLIGGIVMWLVDARSNRFEPITTEVEEMGLGQAIWIGLCQTLSAVFPGTSRSMSTIASGQLAGLSRPAVPVGNVVMNSERWIVLLIGLVVSFVVALGVVEWFLMWVRRHGFTIFAIYRIIVGSVLLIWGARIFAS